MLLLGIHDDIPNDEYHAEEGWSSTQIKKAGRSAAHVHVKTDQTAAMAFGGRFHSVMEHGIDRWAADYAAVYPKDHNARTKAGKEWKAEQEAKGLDCVTVEEVETLKAMHDSARAAIVSPDFTVADFLVGSHSERTHVWVDDETGLVCKCRPDAERPDLRIVLDWKSTDDAREKNVQRAFANFGYHESAAHYLAGTGYDLFMWVFTEKKAPHGSLVYYAAADGPVISAGEELRRQHLEVIAKAEQAGSWPAYQQNATEIELPAWALKGTS